MPQSKKAPIRGRIARWNEKSTTYWRYAVWHIPYVVLLLAEKERFELSRRLPDLHP